MGNSFGISIKGGAARGLGAIAFIRLLQEENLVPEVIAGSSSGGIIAAMYSLGFSWERMIDAINDIRLISFSRILRFFRKGYLLEKNEFKEILLKYSDDISIQELKPNLILFASDIKTKKRYYIESGSLIEALYASCAYPFILPKATFANKTLIDGDLTNSYSAQYIRAKGVDKVIGIGYKMSNPKLSFSRGLNKAMDMYRFLMSQIEEMQDSIDPVDYEFRYDASDYNYLDFKNIELLVERAYSTLCRHKKEILRLLK